MERLIVMVFAGLACMSPVEITSRAVISYEVGFTIRNAGLAVEGSFTGLRAVMEFDPMNPAESRIAASVDVSTIKTGIDLRDKHLLGREYFDAAKYPKLEISSKSLKAVSKNNYEGVFTVVIRDISSEVIIPFSVSRKGRNLVFRGDFRINRRDYGIGKESIILSDDVDIHVVIVTREEAARMQ